jgi:hypothetical protein
MSNRGGVKKLNLLDKYYAVKVSYMKSYDQNLQIYVDIPEQRDLSDGVEVAKMTRDFLEECSKKFNAFKLKYIFAFDPTEETGLKQIFDISHIISLHLDHVMVSANPNICI